MGHFTPSLRKVIVNHLVEKAKSEARKSGTRANIFTPAEAAEELGVAPVTLKRWRKTGVLTPSLHFCGVHLYTGTDLKSARKVMKTARPGPIPGNAKSY